MPISIVAYPTRGDVDRSVYSAPDTLVIEPRLPVLLLPQQEAEFRAGRFLLGWKDTREARRAISVTLPLLKLLKGSWSPPFARSGRPGRSSRSWQTSPSAWPDMGSASRLWWDRASGPGRRQPAAHGPDRQEPPDRDRRYGHSPLREWVLGG